MGTLRPTPYVHRVMHREALERPPVHRAMEREALEAAAGPSRDAAGGALAAAGASRDAKGGPAAAEAASRDGGEGPRQPAARIARWAGEPMAGCRRIARWRGGAWRVPGERQASARVRGPPAACLCVRRGGARRARRATVTFASPRRVPDARRRSRSRVEPGRRRSLRTRRRPEELTSLPPGTRPLRADVRSIEADRRRQTVAALSHPGVRRRILRCGQLEHGCSVAD